MKPHEHQPDKPLLVSVERGRTMINLGRTKFLELLKSQEIPSRLIGGRRLIPVAALEAIARGEEAAQ